MAYPVQPCKSSNLNKLLRITSYDDYVFARMTKHKYSQFCEFITWPGVRSRSLYECFSAIPTQERAYHAVCGRTDSPVDFYADLDIALPPSSVTNAAKAKAIVEDACLEASKYLREKHKKKFSNLVVLQSFSDSKFSYHIHGRMSEDVAFRDFTHVKGFVSAIEPTLRLRHNCEVFDMNVYRPGGQLRIFKSVKTQGELIALDTVAYSIESATKPVLLNGSTLEPHEVFDLSLITRPRSTISSTLSTIVEYNNNLDATNNTTAVSFDKSHYSLKSNLAYVVATVPKLPVSCASSYTTWVRVGLALRCFSHTVNSMEEAKEFKKVNFEEMFHSFSALSPKYNRDEAKRWWNKFDKFKGSDGLDWRLSANCIRKQAKEHGVG